jgi:hypothetical protein
MRPVSGVLSGVDLGTPRAARKLLYVTERVLDVVAAPCTVRPILVHETVHKQTLDVTYNRRWGGWDSNPRPADYENGGHVHRVR